MKNKRRATIVLSLVSIRMLAAQAAAPPTVTGAPDAAAAAQRVAAAMQKSIDEQRASVQKQLGSAAPSAGSSFFVLPPPSATITISHTELPKAECDPLPETEITELVNQSADRQGIDRDLLRGVMRQESGFRPCAVSEKGASGLMQLMPATADQLGLKDIWKPSENVDAGARLLKQMLTRYHGDLEKTLAAYNAGPGAVDAADGVPKYRETVDYIRQILSFLNLNPQ